MINCLFGLFVVLFLTIFGRFLFIQTTGEVQGVDLKNWAEQHRTNHSEIPASRGMIFDRNGMELASNIATYRLYAIVSEEYSPNPEKRLNHVADVTQTAEKLAPIIEMDAIDIENILQSGIDNDRFQVEFGIRGNQLSQEQKNRIEELDLPGVYFQEQQRRYYPNGNFASQVIGLAQLNEENNITGLTGIEAQLNDHLTGKDGSISFQRDKYNVRLLNANEVIEEKQDGKDVHLTIDQKIQTFLEDAMSQVEQQYEPERITATVIDPKTGEILAMSNRPSYNPNDLGEVANWFNDIVSIPIEPGSTMKVFTLAAAIEAGVYNPTERFQSGRYLIDQISRPVTDYNQSWGEISYSEGFHRSSNVAMSKLVWDKMGTGVFLDYLQSFHFDRPTNIDLPREQSGTILFNYPIEQLTTSFGQGTTVTPIQLVKASTAIANEGEMMQPYVISRITDGETGEILEDKEPKVVGRPISKETAQQVLEEMELVITSEVGTGYNRYNLNDYSVAGKTGTAQISNPEGGYLTGEENYIFSFLGMAPSDDPELIMYITVQQPKLEENEPGSNPVSFIFRHVMENSLHYLNIQPDKEPQETVSTHTFPDVLDRPTAEVINQLAEEGIKTTIVGDGDVIIAANVNEGDVIVSTQRVLLITDKPKMPDVTGWSLRSVSELADRIGLDLEVFGSGFAGYQSVEVGTPINEDSYLMVEFSTPDVDNAQPNHDNELEPETVEDDAEETEEVSTY